MFKPVQQEGESSPNPIHVEARHPKNGTHETLRFLVAIGFSTSYLSSPPVRSEESLECDLALPVKIDYIDKGPDVIDRAEAEVKEFYLVAII